MSRQKTVKILIKTSYISTKQLLYVYLYSYIISFACFNLFKRNFAWLCMWYIIKTWQTLMSSCHMSWHFCWHFAWHKCKMSNKMVISMKNMTKMHNATLFNHFISAQTDSKSSVLVFTAFNFAVYKYFQSNVKLSYKEIKIQ